MSSDQRSIDDLGVAYALDALEPAERARFEAEASPEALEEARQIADTATLLSGDEATPPPSLRSSVLSAIAREPQLPAHPASASAGAPERPDASVTSTLAEPSASAPHSVARPGPAERRARARWQPARVLGAVAAGAALMLGGVAIGTQLDRGSREAELGAIVAAADAQRNEVELADGTVATVVWSAERAQSAILFEGLPEAPHGHVYQAWYIDAAGPHDAGVFDAEGGKTAIVLDGEMAAGMVVGVTIEPEDGSTTPTTEPILVVDT